MQADPHLIDFLVLLVVALPPRLNEAVDRRHLLVCEAQLPDVVFAELPRTIELYVI